MHAPRRWSEGVTATPERAGWRRRDALRALGAGAGLAGGASSLWPNAVHAQPAATNAKILRYAFNAAETGFDPSRISDLYSRIVTSHIFEPLYRYDYLARPYKVVPCTAAGMPEASDDFRVWTVRVQPGIHFSDDPAFGGRPRELTAADYAYSYKRFFDPVNKSPFVSTVREFGILGLAEVGQDALDGGRPFDYDAPIEGLRLIDRYTLQFRLAEPRPRFIYALAEASLYGAVAREVVERYGEDIPAHPVGTGPFRLVSWRRASQIVLERNPGYREVLYDAAPNADDAEGQALLQRFRGRRLPMIDRVEIYPIDESQPRWLSFLNGQFDYIEVPLDFAEQVAPNGELAPWLAKRDLRLRRQLGSDRTFYYFNMEDPVVGGYGEDKVALRRALSLAIDSPAEISLMRRGQGILAQSVVAPHTWGYDPAYKSVNSDYDPARANALLDLYGYVDRDGDGWREMPDGSPLVIHFPSLSDSVYRMLNDVWKRSMDAVHVRTVIDIAQWPAHLKAARAGKLMTWQLGLTAATPDVQDGLEVLYGPSAGGQNLPRFRHARYDEVYRAMQALPDGPDRLALLREAQAIAAALAPIKFSTHRIITELLQPRLIGYRRPVFGQIWWPFVDIDDATGVAVA